MNPPATTQKPKILQHPSMDSNPIKQFTQENEKQTLIINKNSTGVTPMKVVEYMLSSMSIELLCKFPDNSAFDFDYTQSSIWSPLVPHPSRPSSPAPELQRKLLYEEEEEQGKGNVKDSIFDSCVFGCFKIHQGKKKKMMMMKRRRSGFRGFDKLGLGSSNSCLNSANLVRDSACCSTIQSKGWKRVLRAASKQFKKTTKKKDSSAHLKLSSNGFSHFYN